MENLITVNELCDLLKVTRQTVANWRKEGLPYRKFGRIVRFDKAEVEAWLKEKEGKCE